MQKNKVMILIIIVIGIGIAISYEGIQEKIQYPIRYKNKVEEYCQAYDLNSATIYAIIKAESGFFPYAKSKKNARGLMQISEATWEWSCNNLTIDTAEIYDEESNIRVGCWYFSQLIEEFQDERIAIIAYNAGPTITREWMNKNNFIDQNMEQWQIPFPETKKYLYKVTSFKEKYQNIQTETLTEAGNDDKINK